MIICICHRVSDRDIERAVSSGCRSFDELQGDLSVATACGACHDCAHETFVQHHDSRRPGPHSSPANRAPAAHAPPLPLPNCGAPHACPTPAR